MLDPALNTPTPSAQSHETSPDSTIAKTTTSNTAHSFTQHLAHRLEEHYIAAQYPLEEAGPTTSGLSDVASQYSAEEQAMTCVEAFKMRIASADQLSEDERHTTVRQAFEDYRPMNTETSLYTILAIRHIVELECDPAPILVQHSSLSFALPSLRSAKISGFLKDLGTLLEKWPQHVGAIHALHTRIAASALAVPAKSFKNLYKDQNLMLLVRHLWRSAHMQSTKIEQAALYLLRSVAECIGDDYRRRRLLAALANSGTIEHTLISSIAHAPSTRLPIAVEVLSCLPRERLLHLIPRMVPLQLRKRTSQKMILWLELIHQLDAGLASTTSSLMDSTMSTLAKFTFPSKKRTADIRALLSAVAANSLRTNTLPNPSTSRISDMLVAIEAATARCGRITVGATLDAFLSYLHKDARPCEPLVQEFLALIALNGRISHMIPFLRALKKRGVNLVESGPLQQCVAAKVSAAKSMTTDTGAKLKLQARTLKICRTISWLLGDLCAGPIILEPISQKTLEAQRQFAHILTRAEANHVLPLAYRNLTTELSADDSVQLIHHLAHQYSTDYTRTQRQAWRAMYYLYKYLRTNSLHIGPLISKAVVRLSIIRPMSENRFVSARRVIWVCHIVARVEGESVAKQLEADFWQWRGELIQHTKNVYMSVGGSRYDRVQIGTMKRLGLV